MKSLIANGTELLSDDSEPPRIVIALDIDGVLSRQIDDVELQHAPDDYADVSFGAAWVDDHQGTTRLLHTAPAVTVELDEIVQPTGVQLLWVTAAPRFVPRAVELAFGGRLADGVVLVDEHGQSNWKMVVLLDYLESVGSPAFVWADNSAIEFAFRVSPAFRGGDIGPRQRLLISPDPAIGLTLDDVEVIRDFVQGVLGGKQ
ncbi:hypothetical protein ACFY9N_05810 [Microbacterium sp. NPDC008134]|uniref:hypothetical protein n=1 Tax=Microbacterium sp. NPDC008134 TaxID=3364183 RepID=UPI0036E5C977